jgi:hypothetical protein
MGHIPVRRGSVLMASFLSDRVLVSALLYSVAVLIAFGPEIRHSFARTRTTERPTTPATNDTTAR